MSTTERPIALALILCDQIITEHQTMKKSLIGTFNSITLATLPSAYATMCLYAALTNGMGKMDTRLRCVYMGDNITEERTLWEVKGPIEFANPNQVVEINFVLNGVVFQNAGLHTFEFYCNDDLLMERRFHVKLQGSSQ